MAVSALAKDPVWPELRLGPGAVGKTLKADFRLLAGERPLPQLSLPGEGGVARKIIERERRFLYRLNCYRTLAAISNASAMATGSTSCEGTTRFNTPRGSISAALKRRPDNISSMA